ncbi:MULTISPECIES: uroporphyrinogen-III C-methyltransferase [Cyanophyceae]|uniref:uroporphyrinogen-III C-methyltransferase n=1 Tax=Cyanophyceae TaxID=3028117 RepID=UPI001686F86E|nr:MULTISPECIES: uroporphyrinogen-III C-methyltransferase [Cyanophyceae]MBD1916203.1 uroporphyrinogen-III C-methyltransferase [Phormidium sp. FACHB-77]MBD2031528.1 uroporphyrinogen-III C-methyltransferase [Phormidium sp. FACHB-322]MBD2052845.1 uroporphyrinogen-III C-methyltransferase [Leptolyngbya sp. FACHB-60]
MTELGTVYVVGAGPGAIDFLTVRGRNLLRRAECLVYDALVDEALLELLPKGCDRINVGKRGGQPSTAQADINQLLVRLALEGRQVVRLKSGDPFIFGRTAAEVQALREAGCPVEVVPGISSALAAPLLAGIPLTDPVWSHGFGVFTAHDLDLLDWPTLARLRTLVLLMGSRHLEEIVHRLRQNGCRGDMPVAIIRWGGHPQQQVWEGTLLTICQVTRGETLSPCVIVFGEVVRLRRYLAMAEPTQNFSSGDATRTKLKTQNPPPLTLPPPHPLTSSLPLSQKTILITRATEQSSAFADLLTAQGATVVDLPALEMRPPLNWAGLDGAIAALPTFSWLILSSANAVNFFVDRLLEQGKDLRALSALKIAVVGRKTAAVLRKRGLVPDFIPPDFVADSLVDHFPDAVVGQRLLFPRVESGGREVLVQEFTAAGAEVVEVAAYESGCPESPDPDALAALKNGRVDVITFASSKTVVHTAQLLEQGLGAGWLEVLKGVAIASIGPKTSDSCREILGRVDIEPAEYTLDGLTEAIAAWASALSG